MCYFICAIHYSHKGFDDMQVYTQFSINECGVSMHLNLGALGPQLVSLLVTLQYAVPCSG